MLCLGQLPVFRAGKRGLTRKGIRIRNIGQSNLATDLSRLDGAVLKCRRHRLDD